MQTIRIQFDGGELMIQISKPNVSSCFLAFKKTVELDEMSGWAIFENQTFTMGYEGLIGGAKFEGMISLEQDCWLDSFVAEELKKLSAEELLLAFLFGYGPLQDVSELLYSREVLMADLLKKPEHDFRTLSIATLLEGILSRHGYEVTSTTAGGVTSFYMRLRGDSSADSGAEEEPTAEELHEALWGDGVDKYFPKDGSPVLVIDDRALTVEDEIWLKQAVRESQS